MAKKINPLQLSYPTFVLGQIINPDEANQNNLDITNKVNEFVTEVEDALALAESADTKSAQAVTTANSASTKSDTAVITANSASTKSDNAVTISTDAKTIANGAKTTAEGVQADYTALKPSLEQAVTDADNAVDVASGADTKANTAMTNASNAVTTANSASTKADTAIATANDAKTIASGASSVANEAKSISESASANASSALTTANSVQTDYTSVKTTLQQAVIDANNAVESVALKASVEYVNNKSAETINYVINEIDRKEPVNTEADLYTIYPDAEDGWICLVRSTRNQYVFNGATNQWDIRPNEISYADEFGNDGIITSEKFIEIGDMGKAIVALQDSTQIATQEEAELGIDNSKLITPLRVRQFVLANGGTVTNIVYRSGMKYWKYTATVETNSITIPVEQYNPSTDVVEVVDNNNLVLMEGTNYTLTDNILTLIGYNLAVGENLHFLIGNTSYDYNALINKPTSLPASGGNADTVNGFTVGKSVPANALFTDTIYTHPANHPASMITGLPTSLPANGGNSDTVDSKHIWVGAEGSKGTDANTIYFCY